MFGKEKINITTQQINQALYDYFKFNKNIELGKIKYEFNKSAKLMVGAKAEVLKKGGEDQ